MTERMRSSESSASIRTAALRRLDVLTKPLGSLGRIEALAAQLCVIQQSMQPRIDSPHVVVFAGDHGAAERGVSAYPRAVTAQMVGNYLAGGAAINVLARVHALGLTVVDAGVDADFESHPNLIAAKIRRGTRDYVEEAAMSREECRAALDRGKAVASTLAEGGCNTLVLGEMGIGNTGAASLLMHGLTGRPLDECVGRGTGLDDAGLVRKLGMLTAARSRAPAVGEPAELLAEFGGYEIAMLVGCMLAAAALRMVLVVDGFAVTVAAALASRIDTGVLDHCVFAHLSAERAHGALLDILGVTPLLDLGMRLGEGSGAALAVPLLRSAAALFGEMATFESAGVSDKVVEGD
jgi:nicotinate-nucleotide--dimethylbenzimidazole phosphoribosyltransferase